MKILLNRNLKPFLLLSVATLVTILIVLYFSTKKIQSTGDLVEHTQEVLNKSNDVLVDILNIETGSRGYIISGKENFLEPYTQSVKTINNNIISLSALTNDNPIQHARIDSLTKTANERLVLTKNIIEQKKNNQLSEAEEGIVIGKGKMLTDKIRSIITAINAEEFNLLKERKNENERSNRISESLFLLLLAFIIVFFAIVSIILNNQKITNKNRDDVGHLATIVEFSDDAIISKTLNGTIKSWNKGAEKMFGYSENEALGKNISLIIPPEYLHEEAGILNRVSNNEIIEHYETVRIKKSGEQIFVSLTISPLKDHDGNIIGISKIVRDNTEQKKASQYARSLIEASLDPLVTISAEGKITDVNDATETVTGLSRQQIMGTSFSDYFTEPEKAKKGYQLVFEKGFVSDYPLTIKHKNGKLTDVLYNASVYKDDKGNVLGVFAAARDITAHNILSKYALSLIEASRDPLFTISRDGKITDMNEATVNVTEESREQLIGKNFINYFTEPDKAKEGYEEVFEKGFVQDYPLTIMDGQLTPVLFNGSVYKDDRGNVLGAVVVARVITEQKRYEKELTEARVYAELATGIAEESKRKAESATRIAVDAVKAKQQFLSNMSHEIRTPMNAIIGFTKVLLKTEFSPKQKEYLTAIKTSGDALIVLINDILDLAKVDAGKMTFEKIPFKMSASINAMIHLFEPKILEKNFPLVKEYDSRIPEVLVGDPVRLHQIILNLLSNAVKFTSSGQITVSVRLLEQDAENATIEFAVSDTGIGIKEDRLQRVFENFHQASSGTSRLYGGTGLGLAIVKQLVEAQGGTITVKSAEGEGSVFSFVLNFQKSNVKVEEEVEILELDTEIKNIKVLVVEDIALNQLLMKTLLDDFGFERDIAENGQVAIDKLKTKSYDVVLMDLQMPVMNGFEATDYIRNIMHSKIPIIALTADVTTVDLAKCREVGMNDYIAKPVDERLLYNKIVGLVKKPMPMLPQKENDKNKKSRCIDMDYLAHRTKSNPKLMMEMIALYLEQTPPLVLSMKQSLHDKDWNGLHAAVHKMIPSFSIMGISIDFENMAKTVQEFARTQQQTDTIPDMVLQLENICAQACIELEEEFNLIKNTN